MSWLDQSPPKYATSFQRLQENTLTGKGRLRTYQVKAKVPLTSGLQAGRGALQSSSLPRIIEGQQISELIEGMVPVTESPQTVHQGPSCLDDSVLVDEDVTQWPAPNRRRGRRTICSSPNTSLDDIFKPPLLQNQLKLCETPTSDGGSENTGSDYFSAQSDGAESDEEWRSTSQKQRTNKQTGRAKQMRQASTARPSRQLLKKEELGKGRVGPKKKAKDIIRQAASDDVATLYEMLREASTSFDYGFGQGCLVEVPKEWSFDRRLRFGSLLEELGFELGKSQVNVRYKIKTSLLRPIQRELALAVLVTKSAQKKKTEDAQKRLYGRRQYELEGTCPERETTEGVRRKSVLADITNSIERITIESDEDEIRERDKCSEVFESPQTPSRHLAVRAPTAFDSSDLGSPIPLQSSPKTPELLGKDKGAKEPLEVEEDGLDTFDVDALPLPPSLFNGFRNGQEFGLPAKMVQPEEGRTARKLRGRNRRLSLAAFSIGRHSQASYVARLTLESVRSVYVIPSMVLAPIFEFLTVEELHSVTAKVSRTWKQESRRAEARCMASGRGMKRIEGWASLLRAFPWGLYLSDGAYKEVFKVWSRADQRFEAMSVMDVDAIEETGNEAVVQQEVYCSLLLSELCRMKICPNFVQVYETFEAPYPPPKSTHWGSRDLRSPLGDIDLQTAQTKYALDNKTQRCPKRPSCKGRFQFIRMELCDAGDLEEYIRGQPDGVLPVQEAVLPFLFQMTYALYAGQQEYQMRHYDIKLLNFLLKDARVGQEEEKWLEYDLEEKKFCIPLSKGHSYIVKLADFGTADTSSVTLGQPIEASHFTTFENTAIDQLLLGSGAKQHYSADAFALGLCMLHLFSGSAPYEELLEGVVCPPLLKCSIKKVWEGSKCSRQFRVLLDAAPEAEDKVLMYNTLYRILVLIGLPPPSACEAKVFMSPVWSAIERCLQGPSATAERFRADQKSYSLRKGNNEYISRARRRLMQVSGAMELLESMLAIDPHKRPSMADVLRSDIFASFLSTEKEAQAAVE